MLPIPPGQANPCLLPMSPVSISSTTIFPDNWGGQLPPSPIPPRPHGPLHCQLLPALPWPLHSHPLSEQGSALPCSFSLRPPPDLLSTPHPVDRLPEARLRFYHSSALKIVTGSSLPAEQASVSEPNLQGLPVWTLFHLSI